MNLSTSILTYYTPSPISWVRTIVLDLLGRFFRFFQKPDSFPVIQTSPFTRRISMRSIRISRITDQADLQRMRKTLETDVRRLGGRVSVYIYFSGEFIILEVSSMPDGGVCVILESTDPMSMWAHSIRNS